MEFYDIGAVVWILRTWVWWVPDFSVERYQDKLAGARRQADSGDHPAAPVRARCRPERVISAAEL
jgi:hypothetical protein